MEKYISILIMYFLFISSVFADQIHLNDGTILDGKIQKVTKDSIEYQTDNESNSEVVSRVNVLKIVYDDGKEVILNKEKNVPVVIEKKKFWERKPIFNKSLQEEKKWYGKWYFGIGYGSGDGGWNSSNKGMFSNNWFRKVDIFPSTYHFDAGLILTRNFFIGFNMFQYRVADTSFSHFAYADDHHVDNELEITNKFVVFYYFPKAEDGIGIFLKAGAGSSKLKITETEIIYDDSIIKTERYRGYGAMIGLGYMFWLGKIFNTGLHFEYSYQKYNDQNKNTVPWDSHTIDSYPKRISNKRPDNSHFWNFYFTIYLI